MPEFLLDLTLSCVIMWVLLFVAIMLVSRLVDVIFPPLVPFLWKTGLIVVGTSLTAVLLALLHPLAGLFGGAIVFLALLSRLLELDAWQCVIIVIAIWLIRFWTMIALLSLIA